MFDIYIHNNNFRTLLCFFFSPFLPFSFSFLSAAVPFSAAVRSVRRGCTHPVRLHVQIVHALAHVFSADDRRDGESGMGKELSNTKEAIMRDRERGSSRTKPGAKFAQPFDRLNAAINLQTFEMIRCVRRCETTWFRLPAFPFKRSQLGQTEPRSAMRSGLSRAR